LTKERQYTGRKREEITCDFLGEQGCRIVEGNYRSRIGEIDFFAEYREYRACCDLKTSRNRTGLQPSLSVTVINVEKLRMLGEHFLSQNISFTCNPDSM